MRSANSTSVAYAFSISSSNVIAGSSVSIRIERCARNPGKSRGGAMYDGKFSGRSWKGKVAVQGASLAFCTQPPCGSITRGRSSYGWIVDQSVAEVSPGTTPAQNSQLPEDRI